jgi:hypothetical protein
MIGAKSLQLASDEHSWKEPDEHPEKMSQRPETVEHPLGTIKARMSATQFLTKTRPWVAAEMAFAHAGIFRETNPFRGCLASLNVHLGQVPDRVGRRWV